jgi:Zn-dependent protease
VSAIPELRRAPVWRRGIGLGRIHGTRIVVAPSWFASAAVIVVLATPVVGRVTGGGTAASIAVSILLAMLLGASVLLHELGHCAAAAAFGISVHEVRLYLVGGVSHLERAPRSAKEESLVAAAGPAASGALALICWALLAATDRYSVVWLITLEMAVANGIVAVFNILPALPLDGGRVLRAAFWLARREERTGTIAGVVGGFLVAAALLVWAVIMLSRPDRAGMLLAVIIATMAFFVAAGAWSEWPRRPRWPSGMTLSSVMRPARLAVAGAAVPDPDVDGVVTVLTTPEGRPVGLIDVTADTPRAASYPSVIPLQPEMIVLPGESPSAVVQRMVARSLPYVAVTGADGRIEGVVMRADVERAMAGLGA